MKIGEIKSLILDSAVVNPANPQEVMMKCNKCGKHFWVQAGIVAHNEKHGRVTKCSACRGRMTVVIGEEVN